MKTFLQAPQYNPSSPTGVMSYLHKQKGLKDSAMQSQWQKTQ